MPHLMFFVAVKDAADWGANAPDTPIIGGNYWFFTPGHDAEAAGLPPLSGLPRRRRHLVGRHGRPGAPHVDANVRFA